MMESNINTLQIDIKSIIASNNAQTNEQGDLVYEKLDAYLENTNDKIVLSFSTIDSFTSAFINNSLGKLFSKYPYSIIRDRLIITGVKTEDNLSILTITLANALKMYTSRNA